MCKGALTSLLLATVVACSALADGLSVLVGQPCPFIGTRVTFGLRADVRRISSQPTEEWDRERSQWIRGFDTSYADSFFDEYGALRWVLATPDAGSDATASRTAIYGAWYDVEVEAGAATLRRYQVYSMRELVLYETQWYWVRPGVYRVVVPYPPAWYEVETKDGSIVLIRTYDRDFARSGSTTYYGDAGYPVRAESYDREGSISSTTVYENGLKTELVRGEHRHRYTYRDGHLVTDLYQGPGIQRETTYEYVLDGKGNWTEMRTYVDDGTGRKLLRRETRTIEYYGSG